MFLQSLTFEGRSYYPEELSAALRSSVTPFPDELAAFLREWISAQDTVTVQTSGSTGTPKILLAEKERMRASARLTCSFLGMRAGERALLCMPLKYIGAKMMVVRSLEYGLDLHWVAPSSHPLLGLEQSPDLLAMTPAQIFTSLETEQEAAVLRGTRHIIIGGGAVDAQLESILRAFPHGVWSSYGMTETLSHIALRRLSGPEASDWYRPFAGVSLRLSSEGTLMIFAPAVCAEELKTNDIAELRPDGAFRILGRLDNVINSGGIKVQIERVESILASVMTQAFQISAAPDPHYGEIVVMLVEGESAPEAQIKAACHTVLEPYSCPKRVLAVPSLPRTGSGKPDRAAARNMVKKLMGVACA